jgi:predicted nucleotidyltransferase
VESESLVARALALLEEENVLPARRVHGVWIFGSRVRGTAHPASDLDLALLCEPALDLDRFRLMDMLARRLGCEVDVIDLRSAAPTLTWEVLTTGRLVLETDALRVEEFVRRARFAAEDAEQRDRMILLAQIGPEARG